MERDDAEIELDLMNLERALLGTRQATTFIGSMGVLMSLGVLAFLIYVSVQTGGGGVLLGGLVAILIYIPPSVLLLASGVYGYRARQDSKNIVMQARLMMWFWYLSMVYLAGSCGLQLLTVLLGFGAAAF